LLKLLAGLVEPTRGTVEAFGARIDGGALRDEATAQGFRRRVGMVFQSADAQLFNPTVRDEVAFGPLHLDLPHDEIASRVDDTLAMLGLGALAERPPYNLSGGEKKKVALASVLSINPEVLMLDEPTNGLDPRTQEWLIELLEQLHHAGKTIVVATHQLDLLERLVDRAVVLGEDHRLAADGPLADVLADRELLLSVNLIHEHAHHHGALLHSHAHAHPPGRERHGGGEPEHRHAHQAARHPEGRVEHGHDTAVEHGHDDAAQHGHDHGGDGAAGAPRSDGAVAARRAGPHDASALAALATELGYPSEPAGMAVRLSGLLTSAADAVFVVADAGGELLGFVHAAEKRLLVSEPFVELEGLIVSAAARRRGVAALLVAAVEHWSLERGVGELRVRARVERDVADRFYRGRGFDLEKQQRVFVKRLEGAGRV
jgi:cobalt/nickel transport system ATP-binding protein